MHRSTLFMPFCDTGTNSLKTITRQLITNQCYPKFFIYFLAINYYFVKKNSIYFIFFLNFDIKLKLYTFFFQGEIKSKVCHDFSPLKLIML